MVGETVAAAGRILHPLIRPIVISSLSGKDLYEILVLFNLMSLRDNPDGVRGVIS